MRPTTSSRLKGRGGTSAASSFATAMGGSSSCGWPGCWRAVWGRRRASPRARRSALLRLLQQRVDLGNELRRGVLVALLAELDQVVLGRERSLDVRMGRDEAQRLVDLGRL